MSLGNQLLVKTGTPTLKNFQNLPGYTAELYLLQGNLAHQRQMNGKIIPEDQGHGQGAGGAGLDAFQVHMRMKSGPRHLSRQAKLIQPASLVVTESRRKNVALPSRGGGLKALQRLKHSHQTCWTVQTVIRL
jgi:hypothetical protein